MKSYNNKRKYQIKVICMLWMVLVITYGCLDYQPMYVQANIVQGKNIKKQETKIPKRLYKKIKGWWTESSSGGCDYKIGETRFKEYDRTTGNCLATWKVKGCKKTSEGYLIKVKYKNYKASYVYNEAQDVLEYHWDWNASGDNYSGSSSLSRGKWNS